VESEITVKVNGGSLRNPTHYTHAHYVLVKVLVGHPAKELLLNPC